jgi:putative salt-induced outer membrane protein YdiY
MTIAGSRTRALVLSALAAVIASTTARAQDDAPKDTVKKVVAVINLGFVNASGNTNLTTLTAGDELTIHDKVWTFKQLLSYVYGKNDSVETANQLAIGVRGERAFGKRWGMYLGLRYFRDPFAGISQRFGEQTGALYHAIMAPKDILDLEAGVGLTQERSTAGVENDFPNGRVAAMYKHSWAKKTYFQETAEFLPDLTDSQNYRANSLTEVVAPLSASVAMRLSYQVAFNNMPEPGFKKSDRLLTAGIQLSF